MLIRAGGGHRIRRSKKNKRTCNDDRETAESLNPGLLLPRFCTCFFTSLFMWAFTVVLFHVSLTRRYSSGLNTRCLEWAQWRSCIKFVWKCRLSCCTLWWLFMLLLVFWIYIYIAVYMIQIAMLCRKLCVICMLGNSYRMPGVCYKVSDFSEFG